MRGFRLKKGSRILGIAEKFKREDRYSLLAGVIMRCDLILDGFCYTYATVGGDDASENIVKMYRNLNRNDINVIMIGGCIVSWFNIIDVHQLYETLKVPVICISYEESNGIEKYLKEYFPGNKLKLEKYRKIKAREKIHLKTGCKLFVRYAGMKYNDVITLLNRITIFGSIPEPIRIAKHLANILYELFQNYIRMKHEIV